MGNLHTFTWRKYIYRTILQDDGDIFPLQEVNAQTLIEHIILEMLEVQHILIKVHDAGK